MASKQKRGAKQQKGPLTSSWDGFFLKNPNIEFPHFPMLSYVRRLGCSHCFPSFANRCCPDRRWRCSGSGSSPFLSALRALARSTPAAMALSLASPFLNPLFVWAMMGVLRRLLLICSDPFMLTKANTAPSNQRVWGDLPMPM
jgi:hypothetical protein